MGTCVPLSHPPQPKPIALTCNFYLIKTPCSVWQMDEALLPAQAVGDFSQVRVLTARFSQHIIFVENYSYICFYVGASLIIQANILKLWIKQNACQIKASSKNKRGQVDASEQRVRVVSTDPERVPAQLPHPCRAWRGHEVTSLFLLTYKMLMGGAALYQDEEFTSLAALQINPCPCWGLVQICTILDFTPLKNTVPPCCTAFVEQGARAGEITKWSP